LVAFEILPQATTSPNVNDAFAATTTTTGMHSHTSGAATTTQKQKLGVVGHRTYTQKNVEYDRYVQLTAVDVARYRADGTIVDVWRTTVTSSGFSDDLRRVHPVLMAGAMRRLGTDTRGKQRITVTEHHPRARYIRGELSAHDLAVAVTR
jgi:hypothetical protein